ncbi:MULTISPECIES: DUF2249 domain-containing protein [Natrialba]|uniref:DUF2249 domain-containing protein n=1 Tax=Natrialba swarupiae TaxID=2448032 RepID=A0A5D5AMV4_9EURY|nr:MULTISPECIES: DUF2249 domain-containing protein [Natrialba]MWV39666.1 DUF2249 domain-containing protein [Natrialba sp. INN-245]TYT62227.1 DUF2249 domain-containing protein [Natrialba swarupiae]
MTSPAADRTLDVREIDGPPFDDIVAALDDLADDERLELIARFEPAPLYGDLDGRRFDHDSEKRDDGTWHVLLEHA